MNDERIIDLHRGLALAPAAGHWGYRVNILQSAPQYVEWFVEFLRQAGTLRDRAEKEALLEGIVRGIDLGDPARLPEMRQRFTLVAAYVLGLSPEDRPHLGSLLRVLKKLEEVEGAQPAASAAEEQLRGHFRQVLQEFRDRLVAKAEATAMYHPGWGWRRADVSVRRILFESRALGREIYIDLIAPDTLEAQPRVRVVYYIGGYNGRATYLDRRETCPVRFMELLRDEAVRDEAKDLLLVFIPCFYEDLTRHLLRQLTVFFTEELHPALTAALGSRAGGPAGIMGYSKGAFYALTLFLASDGLTTYSSDNGATLDSFLDTPAELRPRPGATMWIGCGEDDDLLRHQAPVVQLLQDRGFAVESHTYPGTHAWESSREGALQALRWHLEQMR
jgi:hypothetical protein